MDSVARPMIPPRTLRPGWRPRTVVGALVLGLAAAVFADEPAAERAVEKTAGKTAEKADESTPDAAQETDAAAPKELFTGKVVLLSDALAERKIPFSADEMSGQVVLETEHGELIPLLSDWRGRAFFKDERLRGRPVELVGSQRPGVPYLQVLMVFVPTEGGKHEYVDYWCDICAIPMYQIQPCECCQGEVRLRFTPQSLPEYIQPGPPTE